eukprot:486470-Prorocentrum_lima.AAC.1
METVADSAAARQGLIVNMERGNTEFTLAPYGHGSKSIQREPWYERQGGVELEDGTTFLATTEYEHSRSMFIARPT